ncbi:MAG: M20 family metallo-hydrolase [Muribaculum sp.]|nr:M20 family metallo-hydrolase [Muribaculum sp.]
MDIDELYYNSIDLLKRLIATPSVSRDEQAAADIVEDYLKNNGHTPSRVHNNIIAIAPDYSAYRPTLLLNSHVDTVRPVDGWTFDPFTPTEVDDRLYGLGANDAGASLVSLAATFLQLAEQPREYNLIFVASAEEEVSGKNGIESVLPLLPHIDVAIVGEPTGMHPAISEKGLMVIDAEIHGRSGHAARNEGDNAIYRALPVIETLRNLRLPNESPTLGPVKISVTQINAGTQHNVVPDLCRLVIDVRTTDAYSNIETLKLLQEAVPQCVITPRSTRLNPSSITPDHILVRRLKMLGFEPFGSPTLSDQALMPWPSLKVGPGDSARSHTADEYIRPEEIRHAIDTYLTILTPGLS